MLKNQGFSLIELLVVVTIIGVLAAIALPSFAEFKLRSYNAQALSNLQSMLTAQEAYFVSNSSYTNNLNSLPGFANNQEVSLSISSANNSSWSGSAYHQNGNLTYCYDSAQPGDIPTVVGTGGSCS